MNILRKIWHDLEPEAKTIFYIVLCSGGILYLGIFFFSFTGVRDIGFIIPRNESLGDYATVISGLLGTAVTIIGVAFLIYAYNDQRGQAKDRQRQTQFGLFNKLYQDLLDDISSIQYRRNPTSKNNSELFEGVDALFNYEATEDSSPNSVLNHLNLILVSFNYIIDILEDDANKPINIRVEAEYFDLLLHKMHLLYLAKIYWPCFKISHQYRHYIIGQNWGYPRTLFYYLDRMTTKSHKYIIQKRFLIVEPLGKGIEEILAMTCKPGEPDSLGRELRSIMSCNYDSLQTYWNKPPTIAGNQSNPNSILNNLVVDILGESAFSDEVLDRLGKGFIGRVRDSLYWFRNAHKMPSKKKKDILSE